MNRSKALKKAIAYSFLIVVGVSITVLVVAISRAHAQQIETPTAKTNALEWAFFAAALSTGVGCIGAGIAVAYVGSAAVGAVGEKPEVAGRTLIFVGLAEGIAIYGLIIAIMILGKV